MKTVSLTHIIILTFMGFVSLSLTAHADKQRISKHLPAQQLKWFKTGVGPMLAANAYGDMKKGAHGTFLKMPYGFSSPVHQHDNEYHAVVLSGTIVNSEIGEKDIRLIKGSYWFQIGQVKHVTKCVSKSGCLVFLSQPNYFNFIPEKH